MPSRLIRLLLSLFMLQACSIIHEHDSAPRSGAIDVSSIPDATPRIEPKSKYGNPESYVVYGKRHHVLDKSEGFVERGIASWYGKKFHGRKTSSGEIYDMYAMTAAHKNLPLPAYVEVRNLKNGKTTIVRVNDRGPFHDNRIIDLSYTAALKLDIVKSGTGLVEIRSIGPEKNHRNRKPVPVQRIEHKEDLGFYIQIGAFSNIINAEKLKSKLAIAGNSVKISRAVVEGLELYRVWIGPMQDIGLADKIVANLSQYGVDEHRIVVD